MSLDIEYTFQRLDTLWRRDDLAILELKGNNYVLFSDLHLGNGGKADNFRENEETLEMALKYYRDRRFKLVLVGDIEELWQFGLEEVRSRYYSSIYRAIRDFGDSNVFRIFGNHDGDWNASPSDPTRAKPVQLGMASEALKMKDANGNVRILICHGHQGDIEADRDTWISRPAVRFFRLIEPLLKIKNPRAIRSQVIRAYELIFYRWAKLRKVVIICGHSHRAIFASRSYLERCQERLAQAKADLRRGSPDREQLKKKKQQIKDLKRKIRREKRLKRKITSVEKGELPLPIYFNTGCGIYEDGITGIELADNNIKLVKWQRDPNLVRRYETYVEANLNAILQQVSQAPGQ
jgi:UDP-2,3-diacylglucosamine pyrophosphatase LpxH